jgi:23S rRNA (cytosine1962-C5)-methyltransferase
VLLRWAAERRAPLAADPDTTIYRVAHAAADGLPGVTVDRYGDALVLSLYAEDDAFPPRPVAPALLDALVAATGLSAIYIKHRPRQASRLSEAQLAALAPVAPVAGPDLGEVVAREDGLAYVVRPGEGLNAGLFPDMREGRGRVRAWSAGRRVLNCFAYTCGFGVAATAGGAARVLNLDLSKAILARGQANYRANGFDPDPHDFVFGDVFDWLRRLARRGDRFDLVILDPPGFSTTKGGRFSAASDYGSLAALAAGCVAPDGLLLACCNVEELPWRKYRDQVLAGVTSAGRAVQVAGVYHEPALDFPHPSPGEPYLKMLLLRLA